MKITNKFIALFSAIVFAFSAQHALSAPAAPPKENEETKTCKKGEVYSKKSKKCVKKDAELIPDQDLIEQGWALAFAGQYDQAIETFMSTIDRANPEVFNGVGFSFRKSGEYRKGIKYYKAALKINPDYVLARQYLGEGYVSKKKFKKAEEQLLEIERRCGKDCETYQLLAEAIDKARRPLP